jgi:hypothetical protein
MGEWAGTGSDDEKRLGDLFIASGFGEEETGYAAFC